MIDFQKAYEELSSLLGDELKILFRVRRGVNTVIVGCGADEARYTLSDIEGMDTKSFCDAVISRLSIRVQESLEETGLYDGIRALDDFSYSDQKSFRADLAIESMGHYKRRWCGKKDKYVLEEALDIIGEYEAKSRAKPHIIRGDLAYRITLITKGIWCAKMEKEILEDAIKAISDFDGSDLGRHELEKACYYANHTTRGLEVDGSQFVNRCVAAAARSWGSAMSVVGMAIASGVKVDKVKEIYEKHFGSL